jgi:pimeloyl-ACP methyl ester carboxylesterase
MIKIIISILLSVSFSQEAITEYLVLNGDTLDNFVYQIPENINNDLAPLLVVFHQWSGSAMSTTNTQFDEEAYSRGWYFLSPWGGSGNNYNHQQAQFLWEQEILWLIDRFNIDQQRIYMVGGSMGGASGAIYANNHLDPNRPMISATASASGILDCERRYYEMDGNNSMMEWFGGTPEESPFEYHRNSAVYFDDLFYSMHFNLQHTPLYLDFGATEAHRGHGEDLYELLYGYNQNMWIDSDPGNGHGFSVIDELHTCNWLSQFELVDNPDNINVKLDEPSRAYWVEALNQNNVTEFISLEFEKEFTLNNGIGLDNKLIISINQIENTDTLILHIIDEWIDCIQFDCNEDYENKIIGLSGQFLDYLENYQVVLGLEPLQYANPGEIIWLNSNEYLCGGDDYSFEFFYSSIDVSGDGIWNIEDIILSVNFILGYENLTSLQQYFADINEDDLINIIDILKMVEIILE